MGLPPIWGSVLSEILIVINFPELPPKAQEDNWYQFLEVLIYFKCWKYLILFENNEPPQILRWCVPYFLLTLYIHLYICSSWAISRGHCTGSVAAFQCLLSSRETKTLGFMVMDCRRVFIRKMKPGDHNRYKTYTRHFHSSAFLVVFRRIRGTGNEKDPESSPDAIETRQF